MSDQKPRGTCSVCGRAFRLKKDGTVWMHGEPGRDRSWYVWRYCSGGGEAPASKAGE